MDKSLFEFTDYKAYLRARTGAGSARKGIKSALAKALNVQPTYISQILHGHAHLSLEQAEALNGFFGHSKEEGDFFYLLLLKDRAGTKTLAHHFQEQLDAILKRRLIVVQRLGERKTLAGEQQSIYYSSWLYAAVHMAVTIPELQTREAIAEHLRVSIRKVSEALEFLINAGLITQEGDRFTTSSLQLRLGNDSHNILKHHANWRTQAIESLDREDLADLHYSGVVTLSRSDMTKIKNLLLDAIKDAQKVIQHSKEEEICALNVDLFSLRR